MTIKWKWESCLFEYLFIYFGFPYWLSGKDPTCQCRDVGSIPGSGRFLRERNGNPIQYSCLENPMYREAWWAKVHAVEKSQSQLSNKTTTYLTVLSFSCNMWDLEFNQYIDWLFQSGLSDDMGLFKYYYVIPFLGTWTSPNSQYWKSNWLYPLQTKMEKLYTVSKNKTGSWLWLRSWTPYCQINT